MARTWLDQWLYSQRPAGLGQYQIPTPGVTGPTMRGFLEWLGQEPPPGVQAAAGLFTWPWARPPYNDPQGALQEAVGAGARGLPERWPDQFPPAWVEVSQRLAAGERTPELWQLGRSLPWHLQPGLIQQYEWHTAPQELPRPPFWPW